MRGKSKSPRSRGRQSAQTDSYTASQRRLTSAATTHEEAPPYPVAADDSPSLGGAGRGEGGRLRFIDLFCGIGGFRLAFERAGGQCVFSSDWNESARITYEANHGERPHGDIHTVAVADIPAHDILCAGFPCQPFSIAGVSKKLSLGKKHGFEDLEQANLCFETTNGQSIEGTPHRPRNSAVASSKAGLRVASAALP